MSIDLSEKISCFSLLKSFFDPVKTDDIQELLKVKGIVSKDKELTFFNWGRNALFALFKSLPYKTIHFPAFICSVTTEAALAAGKKVKLLEVDKETFNLDINNLKNKKIKCLVVLHAFGNPIDVLKIKKILPKTFIIEDCAHSLFSKIGGQYVGKTGETTLFSLYKQVPNLNGAVLATNKRLNLNQKEEPFFDLKKRLFIKTKGIHQYYLNRLKKTYLPKIARQRFTDKVKPNRLVLALFKQGFENLEQEIKKRRKLARTYFMLTEKSEYFLAQRFEKKSQPSFYQFVIRLRPEYSYLRDKVLMSMRKKGIFLDRLWYDAPIAQEKFSAFKKSCPNAFLLSQSVVSLPIRSEIKRGKIGYLFKQLQEAFKENL